jgi:hypothetical protein
MLPGANRLPLIELERSALKEAATQLSLIVEQLRG